MGENLALGDGNPATAIEQLKDSNDHCKNMMDPTYNMIGVGLVHNPGSKFRYYWTDSFGAYHRRPDQSCIGGSPAPRLPAGCADVQGHPCTDYKKKGYCSNNACAALLCRHLWNGGLRGCRWWPAGTISILSSSCSVSTCWLCRCTWTSLCPLPQKWGLPQVPHHEDTLQKDLWVL